MEKLEPYYHWNWLR